MPEALWKAAERKILALLGVERAPVTGRKGQDNKPHPTLAVQVKNREEIGEYLWRWMSQIAEVAGDKTPCLTLHKKGKRYDETLIVFYLGDFAKWTEQGRKLSAEIHAELLRAEGPPAQHGGDQKSLGDLLNQPDTEEADRP